MDLILHHFDASPFAEKIRLIFGLKGLTWGSVDIPMVMPKPDLMPLTGGYRKTPTLQMGAEIFCDTGLIAKILDAQHPTPPLYPNGNQALIQALGSFSDRTFFEPGAALSMGLNTEIPEPILKDRKAFFEFMDFSQLEASVPHMYGQFLAQMDLIERQLADGRPFVLGSDISGADILFYFPLWMARGNFPQVKSWLGEFKRTLSWEKTMQTIGHGDRQELDAKAALSAAREATPKTGQGVEKNPAGMTEGQQVTITPDDYGATPVTGELITLNHEQLTLRRHDPAVGWVNTHFPRSGYRVQPI